MNDLVKRRGVSPLDVDISFLDKSTTKSNFKKPFSREGKPTMFLKVIVPFLDGKPRKKKEILIAIYGREEVESRGMTHGQLSSIFTAFRNTGILAYDGAIKSWVAGDNYRSYMSYVIQQLYRNEALGGRFLDLFQTWNSNTEYYLAHLN